MTKAAVDTWGAGNTPLDTCKYNGGGEDPPVNYTNELSRQLHTRKAGKLIFNATTVIKT
jgi:hypothetical protein